MVALVLFLLVLLDEAVIVGEDISGLGAVPHEDGGGLEPLLEVVQGDGDVLGVVLVENPDLARRRRLRHAVAVVVHQHALVLGIPPQRDAELLGLLDGRIEILLISGPDREGLVLRLEGLADVFQRLLHRRDGRVRPGLEPGTRAGLQLVGRLDADVEANGEGGGHGLEPVPHAPVLQLVGWGLGLAVGLMALVGVVHVPVLVRKS